MIEGSGILLKLQVISSRKARSTKAFIVDFREYRNQFRSTFLRIIAGISLSSHDLWGCCLEITETIGKVIYIFNRDSVQTGKSSKDILDEP